MDYQDIDLCYLGQAKVPARSSVWICFFGEPITEEEKCPICKEINIKFTSFSVKYLLHGSNDRSMLNKFLIPCCSSCKFDIEPVLEHIVRHKDKKSVKYNSIMSYFMQYLKSYYTTSDIGINVSNNRVLIHHYNFGRGNFTSLYNIFKYTTRYKFALKFECKKLHLEYLNSIVLSLELFLVFLHYKMITKEEILSIPYKADLDIVNTIIVPTKKGHLETSKYIKFLQVIIYFHLFNSNEVYTYNRYIGEILMMPLSMRTTDMCDIFRIKVI